jgi:hypothetical protein
MIAIGRGQLEGVRAVFLQKAIFREIGGVAVRWKPQYFIEEERQVLTLL